MNVSKNKHFTCVWGMNCCYFAVKWNFSVSLLKKTCSSFESIKFSSSRWGHSTKIYLFYSPLSLFSSFYLKYVYFSSFSYEWTNALGIWSKRYLENAMFNFSHHQRRQITKRRQFFGNHHGSKKNDLFKQEVFLCLSWAQFVFQ